jgi:hypothetical protein
MAFWGCFGVFWGVLGCFLSGCMVFLRCFTVFVNPKKFPNLIGKSYKKIILRTCVMTLSAHTRTTGFCARSSRTRGGKTSGLRGAGEWQWLGGCKGYRWKEEMQAVRMVPV